MKPDDLLEDKYGVRGYAEEERLYNKYRNSDCVLGYLKEYCGVIFLIKGKRKCFGFVAYRKDLPAHFRKLNRIYTISDVMSIIEDNGKISNKDGWNEIKDKMLIEDI